MTPPDTLVVLSDIHVMPPGAGRLGIDTRARLRAVLAEIERRFPHAGLVALAGDLSDDGLVEDYEFLAEALEGFSLPWAATLGNHDNRDAFLQIFPDLAGPGGFVQSVHDLGPVRVVLLDTLEQRPPERTGSGRWGQAAGRLCDQRLDWLDAVLRGHGGPVVLVQHHPVWPVGIKMDRYALEDPERLVQRLGSHDVRQVIAGHIHMPTTVTRQGLTCTTIAGSYTSSFETFGTCTGKARRAFPAQAAVVLCAAEAVTVHFDDVLSAPQTTEAEPD